MTTRGTLAACMLAAALGAGCGSEETSSSGGNGTDEATDGSAASGALAEAKAFVAQHEDSGDRELPTSAPEPQPGKRVWVISCSQASEGCGTPSKAAVEAGRLIGWKMTVFDGKGDPATYAAGVRSAIAAQADGIVLAAVDCAAAQAPLREARDAGIKVYGIYAIDCDDEFGGGGAKVFDGALDWGPRHKTYAGAVEESYARLMASYVIAKTDAKAKIVMLNEQDNATTRHIARGFLKWIGKCSDCEVTELPIAFADLLQGKVQGKVSAALTQHPETNVVAVPYDALISGGVAAAVQSAGKDDSILIIGGEGQSTNIEMIRKGQGADFAAGAPPRWAAWAAIDGLNRVFQGEPQVDQGIGQAVIDKDHNLPTATPYYDGTKDYEANFKRIWGVG